MGRIKVGGGSKPQIVSKPKKPCPYCNREYTNIESHKIKCADNPNKIIRTKSSNFEEIESLKKQVGTLTNMVVSLQKKIADDITNNHGEYKAIPERIKDALIRILKECEYRYKTYGYGNYAKDINIVMNWRYGGN